MGGKKSEWVIIDSSGRDRFGHEGETVIPGAGARWQHLHRATVEERNAGGGSSSGAPEAESQLATSDDEDELPWQVIFIGDENMVERLRRGHRYYEHNIQQAIGGGTCEGRPGGCAEEECPFTMPSVPEADDAFEQGDFAEAAQHYAAAIASACPDCPRDGEYRKFPKWREATLRVLQARSLRRAHLLDQALDVLNPVLSMYGCAALDACAHSCAPLCLVMPRTRPNALQRDCALRQPHASVAQHRIALPHDDTMCKLHQHARTHACPHAHTCAAASRSACKCAGFH